MTAPRLLDLFSGEGGAAVGYARAGFEVVGVDINPQPLYPYEHHTGDAFEFLAAHAHEFDAIHASPPCQGYSTVTPNPARHSRLIVEASARLRDIGKPYVIENVDGAKRHLDTPFMLCGSSFGLAVRRHRWFESNVWLFAPPPCRHTAQGTPVGVYGLHPDSKAFTRPNGNNRGARAASLDEARAAMGMDWASWRGVAEAIPPAYTRWIGTQLIRTVSEQIRHIDLT